MKQYIIDVSHHALTKMEERDISSAEISSLLTSNYIINNSTESVNDFTGSISDVRGYLTLIVSIDDLHKRILIVTVYKLNEEVYTPHKIKMRSNKKYI